MKVHKRTPVEVEAMQWPGVEGTDFDHWLTADDHRNVSIEYDDEWPDDPAPLLIRSIQGAVTAHPGDWVIRCAAGDLHVCKPSVFAETYVAVTEATR